MLETLDHGPVREIRMARPPVNALDPGLTAALESALKEAANERQAVVLSGREGMFSAGLDVPALLELDRGEMMEFWRSFFTLQETIARSEVPVAAAVTGHAPAAGAVMAMYCDYRVMVRGEYRIGLNETMVGLVVPRLIQKALAQQVGAHRAERMIVAGALMLPEGALSAGLVDELADDAGSTVAAALAWCEKHLALPRHAMLGNRRMMRQPICALFDELSDADLEAFVNGWFEADTQSTLHALVARLKKK